MLYNPGMRDECIVDKKYPGEVPDKDCSVLSFRDDGSLSCLVVRTGIGIVRGEAFDALRPMCGLFEYTRHFPIAIMIFRFVEPVGSLLLDFNMAGEETDIREAFFKAATNRIAFCLVDGKSKKTRAVKTVEIIPQLLEALHTIAARQLLFGDSYSYGEELESISSKIGSMDRMWGYARKFG